MAARIVLSGEAVFLRVQELGETRIFLEESKVFVVAGVETIFCFELDGDFQIGHGGIRFASEAIESGQSIMNVIGFRRGLAGFVETFARVIPAADIHHGHAALIVLVRGLGIELVTGLHALFGDFDVHAGAIGKFFAGAFENLFELLFGLGEFLLMKEGERFIVELELRLDARVDHLDATALRGMYLA
jgi:hypothetical protein